MGRESTPQPLAAPRLLDRGLNHLTIGWSPPLDRVASVYNLLLNGQSVYTGPRQFHVVSGLAADSCFSLTVLAFVRRPGAGDAEGEADTAETSQWTPASPGLRASTRARSAVSMRGLGAELAATREELLRQALAPVRRGACAMGGFASPVYTGGGDGFVQYSGVSDEISAIGAQAAAANCKLVVCQGRSRLTLPAAAPLQGRLRVAVGNVRTYHFIQRTVRLHSTAPVLQFTDPREPTQMASVPLRGCRAYQGVRKPVKKGQPVPDAPEVDPASPCFRVECSSSIAEYLFCASNSEQARLWAERVNERTHAVGKPDRWQTSMKAAAVTDVQDNPRRPRNQGVLEQTGTRDAWVTTYLASLTRSGSCPHFPLFFGSSMCLALPEDLAAPATPPRTDMGVLPPRSPGMATQQEFQAAVDEGRASDHSWLVSFTDDWRTDLDTVLADYRGPALDEAFARSVVFQLLFALGVGRHAFGLHHNALLDLSAIKVYQVPGNSQERMEQWCYVTNPGAIAMLPLVFRDEAAAGKEGSLPGTRRRDRLFELIDGADACKRSPPNASVAAAAAEAAAAGSAAPQYSENGATARARTSWCVPSAASDGLRLVVTNFEVASLTRVQLDWWKAGYSFPNTAWRDDLHDLADSLCGRLQGLVQGRSEGMEDLCDKMRAGAYADRPLMALQHPWFADYPKVRAVHPSRRQTFIYSPLTIADIPANRRKREAAKPVKAGPGADGGAAHDRPERRAAEQEARRRSAAGSFAGILALLTPPPPWVELNDGTTITLRWTAHKPHVRPLAPTMPSAPEAFGLLQDRVSVYSGPSTTYALPAPVAGECHVFRVAAYYHALGWTEQSDTLTVGDCSGIAGP